MSSDTITLDYTITPTISTVDSGYVTTSSITGLNSNIWTDDISAKSAITVDGSGKVVVRGDLEVQGRDVLAELDEMRDALMLIKRDVDMEAKYPKLKELKDEYAKQLAKYATFDAIKDSKLTYTDGDNT
jgi:hypothetical protein